MERGSWRASSLERERVWGEGKGVGQRGWVGRVWLVVRSDLG
jgi:hypothetical protein